MNLLDHTRLGFSIYQHCLLLKSRTRMWYRYISSYTGGAGGWGDGGQRTCHSGSTPTEQLYPMQSMKAGSELCFIIDALSETTEFRPYWGRLLIWAIACVYFRSSRVVLH